MPEYDELKEDIKDIKNMVSKGFEVIFHLKFEHGGGAYFNTDKLGGVLIELIQESPKE